MIRIARTETSKVVPNFGTHVVLHGYSADGRASSQAAAHSSDVVSSASSFNIGPSYTPEKGGSGVVRIIAK